MMFKMIVMTEGGDLHLQVHGQGSLQDNAQTWLSSSV